MKRKIRCKVCRTRTSGWKLGPLVPLKGGFTRHKWCHACLKTLETMRAEARRAA